MSMGRSRVNGHLPEEVYIVAWENSHKLYSHLPTARGIVTREKQYSRRGTVPKIYRLTVSGVEEVE